MAIPKTLNRIDSDKAEQLIRKHLRQGTGEWEYEPEVGDFVYKTPSGAMYLIRKSFTGQYETGKVAN